MSQASRLPAPPKRILLVDDSASALHYHRMILRSEPYVVTTALDGRTALDAAFADRPDLILLDVEMPGMGGLEALTHLRGDPRTADIPVLVATVRGEPETIAEAFRLGCSDFLIKPVNSLEMLRKVRRYLA